GRRGRAGTGGRGRAEKKEGRASAGAAIICEKIEIEMAPRQCAGCLGTLGGPRRTDPLKKLTNDHASTGAQVPQDSTDGCYSTAWIFNKRFTINLCKDCRFVNSEAVWRRLRRGCCP